MGPLIAASACLLFYWLVVYRWQTKRLEGRPLPKLSRLGAGGVIAVGAIGGIAVGAVTRSATVTVIVFTLVLIAASVGATLRATGR
jgi:hypothetical protein